MRTLPATLIAAFIYGLVLYTLVGCAQQTPLQRVVTAKQTVTLTATALNQLIDAGKVSAAQKATIHAATIAVDQSIGVMEAAALKGDDAAYRSALSKFNEAMDTLIEVRIQAENK